MPSLIKPSHIDLPKLLGAHPVDVVHTMRPTIESILADPAKSKGVQGYAVGFKSKNGKWTQKPAVTFFVEEKVPTTKVAKKALLPKKIQAMDTDIVEVGPLRPLAVDYRGPARPVMGGFSVGHYRGETGSIACQVTGQAATDGAAPLYLSNNHVLAWYNDATLGDAIIQPGLLDWGLTSDKVGELHRFVSLAMHPETVPSSQMTPNAVDAAVFSLTVGEASPVIAGMGNVPTWRAATSVNVGLGVRKAGRSTGVTYGQVLYTGATIIVGFGYRGRALFRDQVVTSWMTAGGDSGSLLLADVDNSAVGLCFAGSNTVSVANPIDAVQAQLGVSVAPTQWT